MKLIIRLILLTIVCGVGYIIYDLKQKDDLSVESLKGELTKHWETAKSHSNVITEFSKEHYAKLKIKWKEQYDKIDWNEIRSKLKITEEDLEEYKKFMQWAHSEDSELDPDVVDNISPTVPSEAQETKRVSNKPSTNTSKESSEKPVTLTKHQKLHEKAKALLEEAKAINRKAIPNTTGYKTNLRNSVKAYQAAAKEYDALLALPDLSKSQRASYERTLSQINQQIYWGKKFDSI